MPKRKEFSIESDQRNTSQKVVDGEKDAQRQLSDYIYKTGRRPKTEKEKYKPVSIRLHPVVLEWAKAEAERRGVGYQSVINETLLEQIIS